MKNLYIAKCTSLVVSLNCPIAEYCTCYEYLPVTDYKVYCFIFFIVYQVVQQCNYTTYIVAINGIEY